MDPRFIARYIQTIRCAAITAAALLAGCGDDGADSPPPDAAAGRFVVRGTASGVGGPVTLALRLGDDVERLTLIGPGPFAFETRLADGAAYTVALDDPDAPCILLGETGTIAGADPTIDLTCTGPSLASVVVSGVAPAVALEPGETDYALDLPLLQRAVTVTAVPAIPGDTLTIAGAPVESGLPSAEIPLSLGDNPVDIVVENALGWQRTYRLTLRRAAQIAQHAYAKASNTGADDHFGVSVALSGDTLVVGAIEEDSAATGIDGDQDDQGAVNSGAVYVFRRAGTIWQQEAYLKASNTGFRDNFGWSVALSGDTLAVGAPQEDSAATGIDGDQDDSAAAEDSGAVYVFRRTGTTWQQEAYVKASNTGAGDYFGISVALAGDTLAVGAFNEDSAAQGGGGESDDTAPDSGAVYVFRRAGTTWQQEVYLKASNTGSGDNFGRSVALTSDTLAVGAFNEDSAAQGVGGSQSDDTALNSGAVYVFRRAGVTWQQEAYVKASNTGVNDTFGISLALAGDTLAVGAIAEDSAARGVGGDQADDTAANSGAVYVFRRAGTVWEQEAYVKASNTGASDIFGYGLALAGDTLAVGAIAEASAARGVGGNEADDSADDSGAVYLFRRTGTLWEQEAYLKASNAGADDEFGYGLALSGDTLAAGAWFESSDAQGVGGDQADDSAEFSGAVYIFH